MLLRSMGSLVLVNLQTSKICGKKEYLRNRDCGKETLLLLNEEPTSVKNY